MLKDFLKLKGVKQLNEKEQLFVLGGISWSLTCNFSDGTSWSGHTHELETLRGMREHCKSSGGTIYSESTFLVDDSEVHSEQH